MKMKCYNIPFITTLQSYLSFDISNLKAKFEKLLPVR